MPISHCCYAGALANSAASGSTFRMRQVLKSLAPAPTENHELLYISCFLGHKHSDETTLDSYLSNLTVVFVLISLFRHPLAQVYAGQVGAPLSDPLTRRVGLGVFRHFSVAFFGRMFFWVFYHNDVCLHASSSADLTIQRSCSVTR